MLANNVYFIKNAFYHYVSNNQSATQLISNYVRNCNEFIDNYYDTENVLNKYIDFDYSRKKRLATSRFNHLVNWYFNRMIRANLTKEVINICKKNEKLRELAKNVDKKELKPYRFLLCSSICNKNYRFLSFLILSKRILMIFK